MQAAFAALRRDRASLSMAFVLPVAFFSIFAVIFGGQANSTPRVTVLVADQDHSPASRQLVSGLLHDGSLHVETQPAAAKNAAPPAAYTAVAVEAAVRAGDAPVALVIPAGYGQNPISFDGRAPVKIQMLADPSDMVAPQVVMGILQKVAMTAMPAIMAQEGMEYTSRYLGGLTPAQRANMAGVIQQLQQGTPSPAREAGDGFGGLIPVSRRDVVGQAKSNAMVSFYAAAIGVMFLLFTASGAAGSLLDEADSGTLDRVLSSRIGMTTLLAGKMGFYALLAFAQLVLMFLWAQAVFHVDFFGHLPGFIIMGTATALAVSAFGMLLASLCKTRQQLAALSTLLILVMSAVGGSMFPRYLMPVAMQKAGLATINAWAIDGFTKVFWRDEPISHLWPQVTVLLGVAVVLFAVARRAARRWEYA